jgi:drug/metabolite transporter (DMT)-like permease
VAAAVFYTIPLFITLFSALFTGDRVTPRSWIAIIIGFVGVVIIVRPEPEGFNAYVLLPLLAAIFYALAMILTRTRCLKENPKVLALSLHIAMVLVGSVGIVFMTAVNPSESTVANNPLLFNTWVSLGLKEWLAMLVLAIAIVTGSVGTAVAYQNGPSSTVASFDYFYLGFSVLWGFLLFAEVPDAFTVIGIAMVAAAGIIAVRR